MIFYLNNNSFPSGLSQAIPVLPTSTIHFPHISWNKLLKMSIRPSSYVSAPCSKPSKDFASYLESKPNSSPCLKCLTLWSDSCPLYWSHLFLLSFYHLPVPLFFTPTLGPLHLPFFLNLKVISSERSSLTFGLRITSLSLQAFLSTSLLSLSAFFLVYFLVLLQF